MKKLIALAVILSGILALNVTAQNIGTVITNGLFEPYGVAVDATNNVYVTDSGGIYDQDSEPGRIMKYDANTGQVTLFANGFLSPQGLVYVPARKGLVIADAGQHKIFSVTIDGVVSLLAGGDQSVTGPVDGTGAAAGFNSPAGLAVDTNGIVYVADMGNNAIRKIDLAGKVTTVIASPVLYRPTGVAVDSVANRVFIADTGNHAIRAYSLVTSNLSIIAGSGDSFIYGNKDSAQGANALFNAPRGLLWVGGKVGLLVCDTGNQALRRVYLPTTNSLTFAVTNYANSASANLGEPISLATDIWGNFYLTDLLNPSSDLFKGSLKNVTLYPPQPKIATPIIGQVTLVSNIFNEMITKLIPITNELYFNNVSITVMPQVSGVETLYTISTDDTIDPRSSSEAKSAVDYSDGMKADPMKFTIIESYKTNLYIKAYSRANGRISSDLATAQVAFKVAKPIILGDDPTSVQVTGTTTNSVLFRTSDGSNPINGANGIRSDWDDSSLFKIQMNQDTVTLKVQAYKNGYQDSELAERSYKLTDIKASLIGVTTDYVGGIGATVLVPIQIKLLNNVGLRSLQFRVEVTPLAGAPAILDRFVPVPYNATNDYITFTGNANPGVSTYNANSYSFADASGVITRGLAISYISTNANFYVNQDWATVALVAVPVPPTATEGKQYEIKVLAPSATSDGLHTPVNMEPNLPRKLDVKNVSYMVGDCDLSSKRWYNAGGYGDDQLQNNDVNNIYAASLGVRVPFNFSDVFDAMDAYPLDYGTTAGGDGQIRFLDWQVILFRSLSLHKNADLARSLGLGNNTHNWRRHWGIGGRRVAESTTNGTPSSLAQLVAIDPNNTGWNVQGTIEAKPMGNVVPGSTINVPVFARGTAGMKISGLQFRAVVVPEAGAPELELPAKFVADANLPAPMGIQGLPKNEVAAGWSFFQNPLNIKDSQLIGYVQMAIPASAQSGQYYTVHFANADGANDFTAQFDIEAMPCRVNVGTPATTGRVCPDGWKARYFGSYDSPKAGENVCAAGDGFTNLQKYLSGMNPTQYAWRFKMSDGKFIMRWFAENGQNYIVERSTDLLKWEKVAAQTGADLIQEFADAKSSGNTVYYRIRKA